MRRPLACAALLLAAGCAPKVIVVQAPTTSTPATTSAPAFTTEVQTAPTQPATSATSAAPTTTATTPTTATPTTCAVVKIEFGKTSLAYAADPRLAGTWNVQIHGTVTNRSTVPVRLSVFHGRVFDKGGSFEGDTFADYYNSRHEPVYVIDAGQTLTWEGSGPVQGPEPGHAEPSLRGTHRSTVAGC